MPLLSRSEGGGVGGGNNFTDKQLRFQGRLYQKNPRLQFQELRANLENPDSRDAVAWSLAEAFKMREIFQQCCESELGAGKKAVSKLRNKIAKMQGSKRLYGLLANHIDHFLAIFESKYGEGDNLLDARDRFLSLLDEKLRKYVSSSGGVNARRGDSDSDD